MRYDMARRRGGVAAVAGILLVGMVLWVARSGDAGVSGPGGKPVRIAVINMKQISDTCARAQDLDVALQKQKEAKVDALRGKAGELDEARKALRSLVAGKPAWIEQNQKIFRLEAETKVLSEMALKEQQAVALQYAAQVHQAVIKEIEAYAKANQIDVVLRTGETETDALAATPEELYRKAAQGVLYAVPSLDITPDVLRAVDRAYEKEKSGK